MKFQSCSFHWGLYFYCSPYNNGNIIIMPVLIYVMTNLPPPHSTSNQDRDVVSLLSLHLAQHTVETYRKKSDRFLSKHCRVRNVKKPWPKGENCCMGLSIMISVPVCKSTCLPEGKKRFLSQQQCISTRFAGGYSEYIGRRKKKN